MREKWATVLVIGLVGLGLLVYLVVYSVRVSEVAVHKRFGKVIRIVRPTLEPQGASDVQPRTADGVKVIDKAGFRFKLPWPFDTVETYDQRIRLVDGAQAQIQLADDYHLIPRVYATWRITDPVAFEKSLKGDPASAEETLKDMMGTATAGVFGTCSLHDVVNTDADKLGFDQIERRILEGVRTKLTEADRAYGIEVSSLGLTWIALPQGTTQEVFNRMKAERGRLAEKHKAEGQSDKDTTIAQAEAARMKTLAEARADAKRIRAEAETEAARYYTAFAADPELAIFLRELEALRNIAAAAAERQEPITFVLTTDTPPLNLLDGGPSIAKPDAAAGVDRALRTLGAVEPVASPEGE